MAIHSAKLGNYDTLATWGLYMKVGSPNIGEPEPDETLVQIPGSDTLLNLTTSLDGKVHYKKRSITMELLCTAPKRLWKVLQSRLHNALEGKWLQCVFDDDPSWYGNERAFAGYDYRTDPYVMNPDNNAMLAYQSKMQAQMERLYGVVEKYLPEAGNSVIALDGEQVGRIITPSVNRSLGDLTVLSERGN